MVFVFCESTPPMADCDLGPSDKPDPHPCARLAPRSSLLVSSVLQARKNLQRKPDQVCLGNSGKGNPGPPITYTHCLITIIPSALLHSEKIGGGWEDLFVVEWTVPQYVVSFFFTPFLYFSLKILPPVRENYSTCPDFRLSFARLPLMNPCSDSPEANQAG